MADADDKKPVCGLVMPISAIDGCPETHWAEVRQILTASIERAGFEANQVSDADDVGIIQKRIIQNLYDNPIVVCDVSGKNPNVMFELGLRLAFDKPTVIVKDDVTTYSFDTAPIEHLTYPRDLRFSYIVAFQQTLCEKLQGTYARSQSDKNYTTFLKNFGEFTIAKLDKKEVSGQDLILEEIKELRAAIRRMDLTARSGRIVVDSIRRGGEPALTRIEPPSIINVELPTSVPGLMETIASEIKQADGVTGARVYLRGGDNDGILTVTFSPDVSREQISKQLDIVLNKYRSHFNH